MLCFGNVARACVLACLCLLFGCAGNPADFETLTGSSLQPANSTARESCPSGQIKVCDRRKAIGCRCQSPRHMRALIGA